LARKKSRKRIEQEEARLRQERLVYLGTLASGLAHEIRTPLNAIQMNIDLLAEDLDAVAPEEREDFAKRVERIRRETKGLRGIVDAFLAFARPPKLQQTPLDLNAFLSELIEFVEPEAKGLQIRIERDFDPDLYPVPIDPQQFGQVVMNLLTNARQAVGEQGTITIRTRGTDDALEVDVEDDGGGVTPGDEERVFEIFFPTKEEGSGLGLGIARRIVEEHGGELVLENRPGRGALFRVRLPKVKILEYEPAVREPTRKKPRAVRTRSRKGP
jgi:signal transduction histidine kinase